MSNFDQSTEPQNPVNGDTWKERNPANLVVNNWVYLDTKWLEETPRTVEFAVKNISSSTQIYKGSLGKIYVEKAVVRFKSLAPCSSFPFWIVVVDAVDLNDGSLDVLYLSETNGGGIKNTNEFNDNSLLILQPHEISPQCYALRLQALKAGNPGAFTGSAVVHYRLVR